MPDGPAPDTVTWPALREILDAPPKQYDQRIRTCEMPVSALDAACVKHRHRTLDEEIRQRRASLALQLLGSGELAARGVVEQCGFASRRDCDRALRHCFAIDIASASTLAGRDRFELLLPTDFRVVETLQYLGRDPGSLSLRRDGASIVLAAAHLDGRPSTLRLRFPVGRGRRLVVEIGQARRVGNAAALCAVPVVARLLGLSSSSASLQVRGTDDPEIARLIGPRRGLRLPLTVTPADALTWSILGQQITLQFAYQLLRTCTELAGVRCPGGLRTMPVPERLAQLPLDALTSRKHSRSKATYLLSAAGAIARGELPFQEFGHGSAVDAYERLTGTRGIGPWTANYTMMRGFGFNDCVPLGDAGLRRALTRFMSLDSAPDGDQMGALMLRFRPHRSLATYHLWRGSDDALD